MRTYYNNPVVTRCVDKYLVRGYIQEKGYEKLIPKLISGGTEAEQLRQEWEDYSKSFVVKCNHGCGFNILVKDKNLFNIDEVVATVNAWLNEDYWKIYCEPQYRNVPKRFLVEEYLADDIKTYKFYCFNGQPEVCYISSNGENGEKDLYLYYFDMN